MPFFHKSHSSLLFFLVLPLICSCSKEEKPELITTDEIHLLRAGDILFQDLDCGDICEAIERVTHGYADADISHMGVISSIDENGIKVFESYSEGVVETPLEEFLGRSEDKKGRPKVMVGRLKPHWNPYIKSFLKGVDEWKGKPYDPTYTMDNSSFYCAEVIYLLFNEKGHSNNPFIPQPMTFKDPESGEFFPVWVRHYEDLGIPIPEGEQGLNPAAMSRSDALNIIYLFGLPEGLDI
ncbi:MAG: hypothetical protein LPK46_03035 [Bacteroidota bacterium]|nr:hypothetical protein [Bacteroidota bacterium]MDX5505094.1 hypothetical protein [Bacteroidota bacterium]